MRFTTPSTTTDAEDRLPMTSFIDIVFLLLIFFMVTASFVRERELSAALEAQTAGAGVQALRPQIVTVRPTADGHVFLLGQRTLRSQEELTEMLRGLPKEAGVFVRAEGGAKVAGVASALQSARDAGFRGISYVPAD